MIVTRNWLGEFIDLAGIELETLSLTLNTLGLEVEEIRSLRVPRSIVVGYVKSCQKHPNADKLNVCEVDVGGEVLQIVCGAKNVRADIFVVVSKIGAVLPSGLEIKPTTLRDVSSNGMICSSSEIGYESINDGIMILDESIGKLEIGKELSSYPIFDDIYIDVDITPNRGDCLSVLGVARDLACAFGKELKTLTPCVLQDETLITTNASFSLIGEIDTALSCRLINTENLANNLLIDLRNSFLASGKDGAKVSDIEKIASVVNHATGVVISAHGVQNVQNSTFTILQNEDDLTTLKCADTLLSTTSVISHTPKEESETAAWTLIQCAYDEPDKLCRIVHNKKIKTQDKIYYQSSRGSNPDVEFAMDYLLSQMSLQNLQFSVSKESFVHSGKKYKKEIICTIEDINAIIGMEIELEKIVSILEPLYFTFASKDAQHLVIEVPRFRHDIYAVADIAEEILRIINIDNVPSKPLIIEQSRQQSPSYNKYKFKKQLRENAASNGFSENISFVFTQRSMQEVMGFECVDSTIDIANPITNELDTLRGTLLLGLLQALQNNKNNHFSSVHLFESGSIFDAKRNESSSLAFISSGFCESPTVANHSREKKIDFYSFANKIAHILSPIGDIELQKLENTTSALIHPYQSAGVYLRATYVGYISKLHTKLQSDKKLDDTYICEVDLDILHSLKQEIVYSNIAKFPVVQRDLSLVISPDLSYSKIRAYITKSEIEELVSFWALDIFELEDKQISLSMRFELQSQTKTLEEDDINTIVMDKIYSGLKEQFALSLRG